MDVKKYKILNFKWKLYKNLPSDRLEIVKFFDSYRLGAVRTELIEWMIKNNLDLNGLIFWMKRSWVHRTAGWRVHIIWDTPVLIIIRLYGRGH